MSKKPVWLLQTLILSGILNIAFITIFFYFLVRGNPLHFAFRPNVDVEWESLPLNSEFQSLSFDQLVELLSDERVVEEGYRVRDLALGVLVGYHHVDLVGAIENYPGTPKRLVFEDTALTVFPNLNSQDYQNIIQFIKRQPWPFTSKGLFLELEKAGIKKADSELITYFCHRPEFLIFEMLFIRTHLPIQRKLILEMALEGGWDRFENHFKEQEKASDFSDKKRQELILDYIEGGSKVAAYLLLVTDFQFAIRKLDDSQVCQVLHLLSVKSNEALSFAKKMAASNRGDLVCREAKEWLADILELSEEEVAGRFVPRPGIGELRPIFRDPPPASPPPQVHLIQPGESLWLIARKYSVSIDALIEFNHLPSTVIRPGQTLKIPPS